MVANMTQDQGDLLESLLAEQRAAPSGSPESETHPTGYSAPSSPAAGRRQDEASGIRLEIDAILSGTDEDEVNITPVERVMLTCLKRVSAELCKCKHCCSYGVVVLIGWHAQHLD